MTIYSPSGAVVYEAPITKSAIIRRELMGDYYIELVFDAVDRIDIGRGCYILYNNHRFEIMNNVIPDDTNQRGLRYTLRFESQQSQMKRCNVFWREGDNLEVSFALTSDISTFGQLIIDNVNAFLGGSTFSLGSVPSGAEMKTISFAGDSCWDAVATIAETFGVEWWTEEDGDNVRLCFGKLEVGESVEFKKGDIVSSIPSKKGDDANYGTRFYIFGSTKNLPEDYGSTVEGGITNNVVEKRLHLPNGMQYIDAWPNLATEDIVEKTVFFEDVMPTNVETITEVYSGNAQVIPGTSHKVYDVVCANSPFSLDDVIEGETIQANFTSGSLNGQTFDLELTQTSGAFNKTFRIVPKILDKDSLTILPQGEMIPRAGDTFILLNVNLPKGRIDEAEQRLLEVGQEYVKKNSSDTEIYDCPTNAVYCHKNDCNYVLGQRVTLVGDMFGNGRQSRIQGYEKKLYDEYQATYTVGDNSAYSRLASLEKSIRQANYSDRVGLEANIIRSKNDATIPSDFNVYSALASEEMFLSKRRGGTVKGHTDFEKGISLYGMPIYDAEKKRWTLKGDLLVTGAMTMYGLTSSDKPSTIMDAVQVDGKTIIKNSAGQLQVIGGTSGDGSGTGGGGVADSVAWSNVTNKPTWITDTKPKYSYSEILDTPDLSVYAVKSSVDNALSGKADKATTLAGYGITNAYTKSEVNNIIDSLDDTYVTIAGEEQSITAEHNFVNGFKVGGLPIKKSQDKTLYLDANLVVSGAITMYGSDSTTFPTIWASIPFDSTMKWDGSRWGVDKDKVGGGGVADSVAWANITGKPTWIGATKPSYKYSEIGETPDLSIYATQSWVTGNGYITASALEPYALKTAIPTNTNQLTNGAGYITGITSSMVTTALGYTPLSTGGGTITGAGANPLTINSTTLDAVGLLLRANNIIKGEFGWAPASGTYIYNAPSGGLLGIKDDGTPYFKGNTLLHSGNYSDYALPKDGTAVAATTLKTSTGFLYTRTYDISRIVNIGADVTAEGYSTYIDGMFIRFRYGSAYTTAMQIGTDGNVSIGGTTATEKLHVHGNMLFEGERVLKSSLIGEVLYMGGSYLVIGGGTTTKGIPTYIDGKTVYVRAGNYVATFSDAGGLTWNGNLLTNGAITMYYSSDERLKKNIRKVNASEVLMSLGGVWQYEYIDSEVQKNSVYDGTHFGLIYQNVKGKSLDKMCHKREDGMGVLNYVDADFISIIAGATMENISEVEKVKKEIKALRKEVELLKQRVA